jgi:hypothetical protein
MLTRSRVIAGASGLAGEPPDEPQPSGIPMWLRYEIAADIETEMIRDLNLSVQNRTMARTEIYLTPGSREFSLPNAGLENAVHITLQRSDAGEQKRTIDISNIALLEGDEREGKRTVGFYGDKPQRGMLSWSPASGDKLIIWYDRSPNTDPDPETATFTITDSYVPHLKLMLAAQMLEMLDKKPGPVLAARIARGIEQWEQFVASGRQQGVIEKSTWRGYREPEEPLARIRFE